MSTCKKSVNNVHTQTQQKVKSVGLQVFPLEHQPFQQPVNQNSTASQTNCCEPSSSTDKEVQTSSQTDISDYSLCSNKDHDVLADHPYVKAWPTAPTDHQSDFEIADSATPTQLQSPCLTSQGTSSESTPDSPMFTPEEIEVDTASEDEDLIEETSDTDPVQDDKFIIFDSSLDVLFQRCPECGTHVSEVKKTRRGSMLCVTLTCLNHHTFKWNSQPIKNSYALGNILLAASLLFSGMTFCRFALMCSFFRLKIFSQATFYRLQNSFLFPVIYKFWKIEQANAITKFKDQEVEVIGDGRCDSPGYSAKYGTYTMMESHSNTILDFQVVHVGEVSSSNAMELEGFRKCLQRLTNDNQLNISTIATDRHVQIKKEMETKHQNINHQYDIWHFAKNIIKKLNKLAKRKKYQELGPWIQSIAHHLWWSCATCEGNPQLLR